MKRPLLAVSAAVSLSVAMPLLVLALWQLDFSRGSEPPPVRAIAASVVTEPPAERPSLEPSASLSALRSMVMGHESPAGEASDEPSIQATAR